MVLYTSVCISMCRVVVWWCGDGGAFITKTHERRRWWRLQRGVLWDLIGWKYAKFQASWKPDKVDRSRCTLPVPIQKRVECAAGQSQGSWRVRFTWFSVYLFSLKINQVHLFWAKTLEPSLRIFHYIEVTCIRQLWVQSIEVIYVESWNICKS